jgi:hypothetical protein
MRLVAEAPAGHGWLHEIKYDGYRMLFFLTTSPNVVGCLQIEDRAEPEGNFRNAC